MRKLTGIFLLALALAPAVPAQKSGIHREDMDPSCKPCEDFWRYANGGWIDRNPIPPQQARWGTMAVMNEKNRERLKTILEEAAAAKQPAAPHIRQIGDLYAACMDTAALDARGVEPIRAELDQIAKISDLAALRATLTRLQMTALAPASLFALPDLKNSKEMIANIGAGGISLPDRDYYFREDPRSQKIREEFLKHVERMFVLLGEPQDRAAEAARKVMAFEKELAGAMLTNVERRDPYARYHKMDLAGVNALTPNYDWREAFRLFHLPESTPVNVSEPKFLKKLDEQLTAVPLEDWKTWLRWRVAKNAAPHLSKPFRDEDFYFSSTVLTGVREPLPRWQQCSNTVDRLLGDALGREFVARYFPPQAKKRMQEMVENLRATLREELEKADWLAPETKKNAIAKLNAFYAKIGYPDRWRDYSGVEIRRDRYFESVRSAGEFNRRYQMSKIGKPIDRNDWGMTPPTVNAYYNPTMNEIAFPAGILQPPLFDMEADDAVNYGAIGAVIGHEMGHGFDDQGSKYDADGNLREWWTPEDRKKFEERTACVIDQFNTLDVGEGLRHNGKLVVGEALGDLGGLTLAYRAYRRSLKGKEGPVLDGFTADQRFFLSFARTWAVVDRPEAMRLRLNTDPHPLPRFRAIGTLQNMPEFHKAFGCKPGDPMVRPPEKQCRLW
ncbi:MAG: M13 family metallopeptidase [Bryobacteraceae bacterium]|nr:M13 family metallopeptidase [Bryobacteraceae bacterium]